MNEVSIVGRWRILGFWMECKLRIRSVIRLFDRIVLFEIIFEIIYKIKKSKRNVTSIIIKKSLEINNLFCQKCTK